MIVPSIDIMSGRTVQLRHGRDLVLDAGDPLEWLERFSVAGEVAIVDLDAALGTGSNAPLIRSMIRRAACRVGGGIRDEVTGRAWLDAGAEKIVIGTAASPAFCGLFPRERTIAAVDSIKGAIVIDGWRTVTGQSAIDSIETLRPYVSGFLLTQVEHEGAMRGFDMGLVKAAVAAAGDVRVTAAGGITTAADVASLDQEGVDAQVGMALYTGALSLGDAVAAPLVDNSSGLWPTVVSDESGRTLGLAWSTRESLRLAVQQRRGVYWSRSRNEIWVKGETSGNRQELLSVSLDCDRDALQFLVRQRGAGFCHRGTRSCFGDRFSLGALERVIASRAVTPDPSSGTSRLLREPGLLESKLREEADELARARSRDDVVQEAADLLYFALAALARAGAGVTDVEAELALRRLKVSRRPMVARP